MTSMVHPSVNIKKTAFEEHGCFYKVEEGVLFYAPMLVDDSIDCCEDGSENWMEVEYSDRSRTARVNEAFGTNFVANCEDGEL